MKKAFVFLAVLMITSLPAMAHAGWSCNAKSNHAGGKSDDYPTRDRAATRALRECAVRTPNNDTCYIIKCAHSSDAWGMREIDNWRYRWFR